MKIKSLEEIYLFSLPIKVSCPGHCSDVQESFNLNWQQLQHLDLGCSSDVFGIVT